MFCEMSAPLASTVFFGGGTPTILPAEHLGLIVREIRDLFGLVPDVEITTEANPDSVTPAYFDKLRAAGFTRVSLGMQSAIPTCWPCWTARIGPVDPKKAVAEAHAAGFDHVNLDLIYGAPHETDADWQASLDAAIRARPDHISAYALVVEDGTALARQVASGALPPPDDDVLADRYVQADETLRRAGFEWYEVSNWARSAAARSRHNLLYWREANWWGIGPGAHSHVSGVRWWNVKHPVRYSAMLEAGRSPAAGRETLNERARLTERLMLGVRLREGLDAARPAPTVPSQIAAAGHLGIGRAGRVAGRAAGAHPARSAAGRRRRSGSARLRTGLAGITRHARQSGASTRTHSPDKARRSGQLADRSGRSGAGAGARRSAWTHPLNRTEATSPRTGNGAAYVRGGPAAGSRPAVSHAERNAAARVGPRP